MSQDSYKVALQYYADPNIYISDTIHGGYIAVLADGGQIANRVLASELDLEHKEIRNDPIDGNSFVLREIHPDRIHQYNHTVIISDIFGGHHTVMPLTTWLTWERSE